MAGGDVGAGVRLLRDASTETSSSSNTKTTNRFIPPPTRVRAALDVIVESVARGDKVSLVGFGTFDSKERAARDGRNPKTGETVPIAGVCIREPSECESF